MLVRSVVSMPAANPDLFEYIKGLSQEPAPKFFLLQAAQYWGSLGQNQNHRD